MSLRASMCSPLVPFRSADRVLRQKSWIQPVADLGGNWGQLPLPCRVETGMAPPLEIVPF